jgi:hypothetical protein
MRSLAGKVALDETVDDFLALDDRRAEVPAPSNSLSLHLMGRRAPVS